MSDLLFHQKSGLYYRGDTDDLTVIGEQRLYSKLFQEAGSTDVLLDIGAHIGIVSSMLAPIVHRVIAVEPDTDNLRVLAKNVMNFDNVTLYAGAATIAGGPRDFYLNRGKGKCMHSLVAFRGREPVTVTTWPLEELVDKWKPTLIKVDIEGGEWELAPKLFDLPDYVRLIIMELHLNRPLWRNKLAPEFHEIMSSKYDVVIKPKFGPGGWGTTVAYRSKT
jgi:FkbM family methyltransferase